MILKYVGTHLVNFAPHARAAKALALSRSYISHHSPLGVHRLSWYSHGCLNHNLSVLGNAA
eukprot:1080460-Amorphochlora_amoeboformis.AAC.1